MDTLPTTKINMVKAAGITLYLSKILWSSSLPCANSRFVYTIVVFASTVSVANICFGKCFFFAISEIKVLLELAAFDE